MPQVTINGEQIEAKTGEKLLSAARRHAAHIGFVCDGRGLCQTCACRVISGGEHLGEKTAVEQEALTQKMQEQGYRLACQATVSGSGAVEVISRAEELRQAATAIFQMNAESNPANNAAALAGKAGELATNYLTKLPYILSNVIPRFQKMPLKLNKVQTICKDATRVAKRNITGSSDGEEPTEHEAKPTA
jgi:ferredoxin